MSHLVFLSVPPRSKTPVKASLYKCPTTHARILANECMVPMSPYVGKVMQRTTTKRISVEASDVKEAKLKVVGKCKNCQHTLIASDKAISSLANRKPHCVICGTEMEGMADQSMREDQPVKDIIPDADLEMDENLHDDPDILHGNPAYEDVGLNKELLDPGSDQKEAMEIMAAMDDDEDDGSDYSDDGDDSSYDDDDGTNEDDDGDYSEDDDYDSDEDDDDGDLGDNDYYDDEEPGEEGEESSDDEEPGDQEELQEEGEEQPEEAEVHPTEDDDDTMDATASDMDEDEKDDDDLDQPHAIGEMDMTTMDPDLITQDTSLRTVGVNASDALHSVVASDSAVLAVLPIDTSSAMILAMVEDVGYMPYIALEASKASNNVKPLFANPSKLVNAVNTVLANTSGDIAKDLAGFGVRQITYSVRASALIKKRIKEGVAAATSALEDEKAHIVDDLKQCLAIAATHVLKNLSDDATNVVSAALSENLKNVGVRSANKLVDDAFTQHGPELMKTIIAKALDLMNKPYDTRNEIAKYVTAATGRNVLANVSSKGDRIATSLAAGVIETPANQTPAGNAIESASAANVIPITASSNVNFSAMVKNAAAAVKRHAIPR